MSTKTYFNVYGKRNSIYSCTYRGELGEGGLVGLRHPKSAVAPKFRTYRTIYRNMWTYIDMQYTY